METTIWHSHATAKRLSALTCRQVYEERSHERYAQVLFAALGHATLDDFEPWGPLQIPLVDDRMRIYWEYIIKYPNLQVAVVG